MENEPPQDKTCYSGRFLDSLRSLGMTYREVFPFNRTGYIRYGASPSRGWSGDESSPLHCTVYQVVPFTSTGSTSNVAGGRLPMKLWCDCHRQSMDFDSLREAPPLRRYPLRYRLIGNGKGLFRVARMDKNHVFPLKTPFYSAVFSRSRYHFIDNSNGENMHN